MSRDHENRVCKVTDAHANLTLLCIVVTLDTLYMDLAAAGEARYPQNSECEES